MDPEPRKGLSFYILLGFQVGFRGVRVCGFKGFMVLSHKTILNPDELLC